MQKVINENEVKKIIDKLKCGIATGVDGITEEMLKIGGNSGRLEFPNVTLNEDRE